MLLGGITASGVILLALFFFGKSNSVQLVQSETNFSAPSTQSTQVTTKQDKALHVVDRSSVLNTQTEAKQPATDHLDQIGLPIADLKRADLRDMFDETRDGTRRHEAVDIMAPRGTPIIAVTDGIAKKLFTSKAGGLTIYQYDMSETYSYYYAHLDRYAEGLQEGQVLKKGQLVGYVGSTGNANPAAPHLHFAMFKLGTEKRWWEGTPINPYPYLLKALDQK